MFAHRSSKRLPDRTALLLLSLGCLGLSGCAGADLETGALQLGDANATTPAPPATEDPGAPTTGPAPLQAAEAPFAVAPETATLIKKARGMRASGDKTGALALLDKATNKDTDLALVKERGLLAAELGQLARAEELLRKADDPKAPDWRVHSALGATLSASGRQAEARAEFAKALAIAPDHPSVLNNLALTYAMEGNNGEAERTLRRAASQPSPNAQPKQNLALVLALNGNTEEARKVSAAVLPADKTDADMAYLERLRSGKVAVSSADPTPQSLIRATAVAKDNDKPIMALGSTPD